VTLHIWANLVLGYCLILSVIFVVCYGTLAPWYSTYAGRVAFGFACTLAFAFAWIWLSKEGHLSHNGAILAWFITFGSIAIWLTAMLVGLLTAQWRGRHSHKKEHL
jgi:hypothetical protein